MRNILADMCPCKHSLVNRIGNGDVEKFISMMLNQHNGTCSQTGRCSAWGVTSCWSSAGVNVGITWELTQPMP